MLDDLASIIPHCGEVGRELSKLLRLTQAGLVIDFIIALFEHLSVYCLDLN